MARHRVADADELSDDGSRVITEVDGQEIAVFRIDGEYHALPNYCIHQAGPLCEGELTGRMVIGDDGWEWLYEDDGRLIACPWHGWKFDIATGVCANDSRYSIPHYDVEIEDGGVYVVR